jgi:Na+/H+ antiporter NhaD/arsenite permease-like protein
MPTGKPALFGSLANLIAILKARREGVAISFWEYLRVCLRLTLVTLALAVAWRLWA